VADNIVALVNAQSRARQRIAANVLQAVARIIAGLAGKWYDDSEVRAAGTQIAELVHEGQIATGDSTAAYLDLVLAELGARPPRDPLRLPDRLRQVDPDVEWIRPAKEYRRARLAGLDEFEAQERAARRAELLADMDLSLAMREASRQHLAAVDSITGWRRVIHPELSKGGTCGLCIVASDRIYKTGDLMPLHDRCECEPLPIIAGKADPGRSLNADDLSALYEAAGGTSAERLKRVRIAVHEHGELGPVLTNADHAWRGPDDVAADVA
jgi:hypothetical protein